jgi:hypothetical protein
VVIGQIARHINKNLVDGVGVDICRGHIFEVGLVDLGGHVQIPLHPGRRNDVAQAQRRVCVQGVGIKRGAGKVVLVILSPGCLFLPDGGLRTPPRHRNFSGRLPDRCAVLPYFSPPLCYLVSTSTNHLPNREGNRGSERSKNRCRFCPFTITV